MIMVDSHIIGLFVISILVILYAYFFYNSNDNIYNETMYNVGHSRFRVGFPISRCSACDDDQDNQFPFWNSTRHTRNSSWDIRGDVPIDPYYSGPFWQSPLI